MSRTPTIYPSLAFLEELAFSMNQMSNLQYVLHTCNETPNSMPLHKHTHIHTPQGAKTSYSKSVKPNLTRLVPARQRNISPLVCFFFLPSPERMYSLNLKYPLATSIAVRTRRQPYADHYPLRELAKTACSMRVAQGMGARPGTRTTNNNRATRNGQGCLKTL